MVIHSHIGAIWSPVCLKNISSLLSDHKTSSARLLSETNFLYLIEKSRGSYSKSSYWASQSPILSWWHEIHQMSLIAGLVTPNKTPEKRKAKCKGRLPAWRPPVPPGLCIHSQASSSLFMSLFPLCPFRQVVWLPLFNTIFLCRRFGQLYHLSLKLQLERERSSLADCRWEQSPGDSRPMPRHRAAHACSTVWVTGTSTCWFWVPEPFANTLFSGNPAQVLNEWLHSSEFQTCLNHWSSVFQEWVLSFKTLVFKCKCAFWLGLEGICILTSSTCHSDSNPCDHKPQPQLLICQCGSPKWWVGGSSHGKAEKQVELGFDQLCLLFLAIHPIPLSPATGSRMHALTLELKNRSRSTQEAFEAYFLTLKWKTLLCATATQRAGEEFSRYRRSKAITETYPGKYLFSLTWTLGWALVLPGLTWNSLQIASMHAGKAL